MAANTKGVSPIGKIWKPKWPSGCYFDVIPECFIKMIFQSLYGSYLENVCVRFNFVVFKGALAP
jgi:hypothetical protein